MTLTECYAAIARLPEKGWRPLILGDPRFLSTRKVRLVRPGKVYTPESDLDDPNIVTCPVIALAEDTYLGTCPDLHFRADQFTGAARLLELREEDKWAIVWGADGWNRYRREHIALCDSLNLSLADLEAQEQTERKPDED